MSKVEGLSLTQFKQLRRILSIQKDPAYAYGGFNNRQYLMDARGSFPTGLLYLVKDYLKHLEHTWDDIRRAPVGLDSIKANLSIVPYAEQKEAARACLKHRRGLIIAPTGFGKSILLALIIDAIKVPTLIVVPNLELRSQLTETLRGIFGHKTVGRLGHTIAVENIDALDPKVKCNYGMIIVDEDHHSAASSYRKLNQKSWTDVYHRFGVTATGFRSNPTERLLFESFLSEVIYEVPYKTAVSKGYIAPLEAYYLEMPKTEKFEYGSYAAGYAAEVVNNTGRNMLIAIALARLNQAGKSTLCLVKQIDHGEKLQALTGIRFVKGENDDNSAVIAEFNQGGTALIGTHGVLGEGVDTKACEFVVIATPMKSKNLFMQCVGRAFRRAEGKESAKVIIIKDVGHRWFRSAFKEQVKILEAEYGVRPIKLDLS